jgi:CRISPR/Cas system CMR-associated protein Cmr3 (group 5 of RAMP superfamily)
VLPADSEDNLQRAVYKLSNIASKYNLKMYAKKAKVLAFVGMNSLRAKIMINGKIIEQVNSFNYLGCNLSHISPKDFDNKPIKFQQLTGTTKKTLLKRVRTETILKFYKTLVIPTLLYGSET